MTPSPDASAVALHTALHTVPAVVYPVALAAVGGAAAGAATRWLLSRMRRGALVAPPWCELALAAVCATLAAAWATGRVPGTAVPLLLVLAWVALACSVTDLRHRRLPDRITVPALPAVVVALVPAGTGAVQRGLAGATLLAIAYGAVHLAAPAALGAGDVKLAAPVGAALAGSSWHALVAGVAATAVVSGAIAVAAVALGRAGWRTAMPHGPPLAVTAWLVVALGSAAGP